MNGERRIEVESPDDRSSPPWAGHLHAAARQWRDRTGHWPSAFVSDITTLSSDPRADLLRAALLDCGFAVCGHREIDSVDDVVRGVRATDAKLVVLCARGPSNPSLVRPFVLALPEVDYILVAGDAPGPSSEREGDPAGRGFYVDAVEKPDVLPWIMQFVSRGLGIARA